MSARDEKPPSRSGRILLILQRDEDRAAARDALIATGNEVLERESPIGATVEIVRSHIDVVVIDVNSPVMSGDRFAALVRRNPRLDGVGLILISEDAPSVVDQLAAKVEADAGLHRERLDTMLAGAVALALGRSQGSTPSTAPPRAVLMLESDRFALPLAEGRQLIGREVGCRFVLNHPSVSRQHAAIEVQAGAARVVDLGSHNGTRVNDELIDAARDLDVGDVIRLGEEVLVLVLKAALSRETVELDVDFP